MVSYFNFPEGDGTKSFHGNLRSAVVFADMKIDLRYKFEGVLQHQIFHRWVESFSPKISTNKGVTDKDPV